MWWKTPSGLGRDALEPGRVTDRRTTPAGVAPPHLQQWALVGVALVMVGIIALSGSPTKPRATTAPSSAAAIVDPNQQRIEEYQRRIQEQAQRLTAEQAQLEETKDAVTTAAGSRPQSPPPGEAGRRPANAATSADRTSREDHARFADNVAFSRGLTTAAGAPPPDATRIPLAASPLSPSPTAVEPATTGPVTAPRPADRVVRSAGDDERYRLFEGTFIDTVLTNRLDGTLTGPVNCLVSVPVYASDEQHLVIPAGSRVLGEARAVNAFGQSRLAVVFHRVLLPNGTAIDLNGFHGLNQVGDLGLQDQVDRHYAEIFGVSLAIGAIAGFAQAQSAVGFDQTAFDAYRQGAAANVSQSSARILDRFLNLLPTVTIREGHRIKVYLSNDLDLPAYRESLATTGGRP